MRSAPRLTVVVAGMLLASCTGASAPAHSGGSLTSTGPAPATSSPSAGASPATSLSGRIAFDNFDDVWVINADGTGLTRLTSAKGPDFDPSWSPDGARIAFRSERSGKPEVWIMNADGTGQRRLASGLSPAWSPDGSQIAFAGPSGGLGLIRPDGSGMRALAHTEGGEYPSWSPGGSRIAFNSNLSGDHVMFIANIDGSGVKDLSKAGEGWQVDWSPDGRSILFASHRDHPDNYTDVYVMRPDGSGVTRLTHNRAYTPAWSPDGSHIVFSAPGLFVMNPDGTAIKQLPLPALGETSLPDWTG
jgi:Tol biopolymer transport system component